MRRRRRRRGRRRRRERLAASTAPRRAQRGRQGLEGGRRGPRGGAQRGRGLGCADPDPGAGVEAREGRAVARSPSSRSSPEKAAAHQRRRRCHRCSWSGAPGFFFLKENSRGEDRDGKRKKGELLFIISLPKNEEIKNSKQKPSLTPTPREPAPAPSHSRRRGSSRPTRPSPATPSRGTRPWWHWQQ